MPNKTATKKTVKVAKPARRPFLAKRPSAARKPVVKKSAPGKPVVKKSATPVVHVPATSPTSQVSSVVQQPQATEADKIWAEIRFRPIEMFGLPNQIVEQHVVPFPADPNKLFLTPRSSAVLPSLEFSCRDFTVELADRFIIVSRAAVAPIAPHFPGAPFSPKK